MGKVSYSLQACCWLVVFCAGVGIVGCGDRKRPKCGDGERRVVQACNDGNSLDGDGCDNNCTVTKCGNGVAAGAETCDDGNLVDGDGCDSNCQVTACGNGIVAGAETCDDGNVVNGDGCDSNCRATACGNGITTGTESCDDGNFVNGDGCDNNCTVSACGNGITAGEEACDNGGVSQADCNDACRIPGCGDSIINGPETCDDGNLVNGDGCDNICRVSACGNGVVAGAEQCDDGNLVDSDGCSGTCVAEPGSAIQCAAVLAQWVDLLSRPTPLCAFATNPPAKPYTEDVRPLYAFDYKVDVGDAFDEYEDYFSLLVTWRVTGWKLQNACGPYGPELSIDAAIKYHVVHDNGEAEQSFILTGPFDIDARRPIDPERPWSVIDPTPSLWTLAVYKRSFAEYYVVRDLVGPLTRNADATTDPKYCE